MNYELILADYARTAGLVLVFSCVAALCVRSFWRNGNRIRWTSLLRVFAFSVLILWIAAELLHRYAHWRVSVYDANGDQFFSNGGRLDDRLYDRLMEIAVNDTGHALQPLGSVVVSLVFILLGQGLAYLLTPIRRNMKRHK